MTRMVLGRFAARPLWLPSPLVLLAVLLTLLASAPLVVFGLASFGAYVRGQLDGGVVYHADFLNYYSAARMLLEQPGNLYLSSAEAAFQRQLAGGADVYDQFWSLPQLGLLFVPLALLPYATAYLAWSLINLALLAVSAFLVAPPVGGHNAWWLWTLLSLCFLPVQQALVDGQTPFIVLFGFCCFVWLTRRGRRSAPLALLTWAWKPQLMVAPLLALLAGRRWRAAAGLVLAQLVLSGLVVVWAGAAILQRYVQLTRVWSEQTTQRVALPGQTVLGLGQSLFGVGPAAVATAGLAAVGVALVLGWAWRVGVRQDAGQPLQLALLPVASILVATRAGTYELTVWLATAWLLLDYARRVPSRRRFSLVLLFVGWWGGDLASLNDRGNGLEWGTVAGLVALGGIAWLLRQPTSAPCAAPRRIGA